MTTTLVRTLLTPEKEIHEIFNLLDTHFFFFTGLSFPKRLPPYTAPLWQPQKTITAEKHTNIPKASSYIIPQLTND